jgi:hypothetical protein
LLEAYGVRVLTQNVEVFIEVAGDDAQRPWIGVQFGYPVVEQNDGSAL